jgi:potassium-transporting ATPase KdpC subunit
LAWHEEKEMLKQIIPAVRIALAMTVLTGLLYSGAVTGLCQILFRQKANGSLLLKDDRVMGSSLIGQNFTSPGYFHSRPSAAGYDASTSSGSNLGPTSRKLIERVKKDIESFRKENPAYQGPIPADLTTSSGSGLDPHISPASAHAQAARVASARSASTAQIERLIEQFTEGPSLGFIGEPRVNVLELNMALNRYVPQ